MIFISSNIQTAKLRNYSLLQSNFMEKTKYLLKHLTILSFLRINSHGIPTFYAIFASYKLK